MNDRVKLEIFTVNMATRGKCHATGETTGKTNLVAEVTEGEAKGFRVGEECLRRQNVQAEMMDHADRLEKRAAKMRELAPRLIVPTWREYQLAELREAVRQSEQIRKELGGSHAQEVVSYASADDVLSRDEILEAFGVTQDDVEAGQRRQNGDDATDRIPF